MTFDTITMILLGFTAPLASGIVCLIIIVTYMKNNRDLHSNKIARVLFYELAACVCCWIGLTMFLLFPTL